MSSSEQAQQPGHWAFSRMDAALAAWAQSRLPERMFDVHAHLYRVRDLGRPVPDLAARGPASVTTGVWRRSLGRIVGARRLSGALFIPYPTCTGDVDAGNAFVAAQLKRDAHSRGLMVITPRTSPEDVEPWLADGRIVGFKPYHVYAAIDQTFDAVLDQYLPAWAWETAHRRRLILMVHLVRAGALSDAQNQRTIIERCAAFPNARLILAHAGRGFHAPNTINALPALRGIKNVWFDTSAICEPDALMAIVKAFGPERLLWGSDFPVSQQRGKCVTVGDAFSWICPSRIDADPAAPPCHPTLVGLESLRALLLAAQLLDLRPRDLEAVFLSNALRLLRLPRS